MTMTQKNNDHLVKELRELVIVQEKRVTFNFLSRKYGISVFRSQELIQKLKEQLKKDGRDNEIVVSYVITGYMDDTSNTEGDDCFVKTIKIMHVDETELEECKHSFSKVTGVTVKSIRGSNVSISDRSLEDTLTIETHDNHSEPSNYREASPKVSKADISQSPKNEKKVDILDEDSSNDSLKLPDNSSQETSRSSKSSSCKEEPECSIANGTLSNKQSTKTAISNGNGDGVSSDDDEEPITKKRQPKIEKSDSDDEEIVVPKKRRRVKAYDIDSEEEGDEVEKDQENEETLEISNCRKQKSRATAKEEKDRERQRKMNGKVKVKEDDPGEPHELIEEDEVDVDEDGYAVTRKVKRAVKKEAAEMKVEENAKPDLDKKNKSTTSSKVQETESNSSQMKKQKPILCTSQKKITDFFSKPKK